MEISRLGVLLELQLLAFATATATQDPSRLCDLYHSSQQRQILNPLSEAADRTRNLMVPSRIGFCCATTPPLISDSLSYTLVRDTISFWTKRVCLFVFYLFAACC